MTTKHFWRTASNWGFLGGIALFVINLISWGLKLELNNITWPQELMLFAVICSMIIYTGKKNVAEAGSEGYSYGRAVGFVFVMMMFAGIVSGVGRFLMYNFIAPAYYGQIIETSIDLMLNNLSTFNPAITDLLVENRETYLSMMKNPFVLIFSDVIVLCVKGGFLGVVLCAFFYKKPDIFAKTNEGDNDGQQA